MEKFEEAPVGATGNDELGFGVVRRDTNATVGFEGLETMETKEQNRDWGIMSVWVAMYNCSMKQYRREAW